MFKAVVGHSNDPDSQAAIAEVLKQCQADLDGLLPQAGVLMAAIDFDHPMILAEIQTVFPGIELIGCTCNGEISSKIGFQEDSLSLMLFCSDTIEIKAGLGRGLLKDIDAAVAESIQMATTKLTSAPKLCLTFPESIHVNATNLIAALQSNLGKDIPVIGGTSADDLTFDQPKQFFQSEVMSGSIPVLLFAGNLQCSHGVASGWQPIGKPSTITKAINCTIYEIDGKKALNFYKDTLNIANIAAEYVNYPLAISVENGSADFYLNSPLGHNEEDGSMIFTSSISEGTTICMSEASRESILNATTISLENAFSNYVGEKPAGAFIISCAARRIVLGTQTKQEYEIFKTKLPDQLPCCGFYSYGEISPMQSHQPSQFHNQTFVTLLIGEA